MIVLHSGHFSKPFKALMGTSDLKWRVADEQEIVWCVNPSHPIADGIEGKIVLEKKRCTVNSSIFQYRMLRL